MKTELTKEEAEKRIEGFFKKIKSKKPEEIKKIKRFASHYKIKLKDKKKKFCKSCFSPKLKIKRIKNQVKTVECQKCKKLMRWKFKTKIS